MAQEFISDINKNSPEYLHDLYLSTKVVQDAIVAQNKVLHKIAENGSCVIVGRSADYVLRDIKDVVRIFVYAPEEYRVGRVMEIYGDTRVGNEWGDRRHYDLLVDSSVGLKETAEVIMQYITARNR